MQNTVEALTAELTATRDKARRAEDAARKEQEDKVDVSELETVQRAARDTVAAAKAEYTQRLERSRAGSSPALPSLIPSTVARRQQPSFVCRSLSPPIVKMALFSPRFAKTQSLARVCTVELCLG